MLRNGIDDLENKLKFKGDLMLGASEKDGGISFCYQL